MKALILNSGIGNRMGDLTRHNPKCLVEISIIGTILSLEIRQLLQTGINEFIITTGPFPGMIEEYLIKEFGQLNVTYVPNPEYALSNYIYSMHLARKYLIDDLILLHGDMVAEPVVYQKLVTSEAENSVIVNPHVPLPEKDFKGKLINGFIREIGVKVSGPDCVFLLPMYKFSRKAMAVWMEEIATFIERGKRKVYAEEAFNNVSDQIALQALAIEPGILCTEIDTPDDLRLVTEQASRLI